MESYFTYEDYVNLVTYGSMDQKKEKGILDPLEQLYKIQNKENKEQLEKKLSLQQPISNKIKETPKDSRREIDNIYLKNIDLTTKRVNDYNNKSSRSSKLSFIFASSLFPNPLAIKKPIEIKRKNIEKSDPHHINEKEFDLYVLLFWSTINKIQ